MEYMKDNEEFTILEIGKNNLEEPNRLSIKNIMNQFHVNPLIQKQLQLFDSNSLKGLFLNIFDVIFLIFSLEDN